MSEIRQSSGRGWFWFWLLLTLLFLAFCIWHSTSNSVSSSIPNDVDRRVAGIVAGTGLAGKYKVDGRDVIFSGSVPESADMNSLLQQVDADPAVHLVRSDDLTIIPGTQPTFRMESGNGEISLTGLLPDEAAVTEAVGAVEKAFPNQKINNGLQVDADVTPQPWISTLDDVMPAMAGLQGAGIDAAGDRVELFGGVASRDEAIDINAAASDAFGNAVAVRNSLSLATPRQDSRLLYARNGDQVTLSGRVPDQTSVDNIMGAAESIFGAGRVSNELEIDSNTKSAEWIDRGSSLFATLDGLQDGRAEIVGDQLSVAGVVRSDTARESIINTLGASAQSLEIVREEISVVALTPASVSLAQNGDGAVTLTGRVSSQTHADDLLRATRSAYPAATITNNITVSDLTGDAPWANALDNTMNQLNRIDQGELSIGTAGIRLAGTAATDSIRSDIERAATGLAISPVDNQIAVVPLASPSMQVSFPGGLSSPISMRGQFADNDSVDAVRGQMARQLPGAQLDDQLNVGDRTATAEWTSSVGALVSAYRDADSGAFSIEDERVRLEGSVTEAGRTNILNAASQFGLANGVDDRLTIKVVEVNVADQLRGLDFEGIQFKTNSDELVTDSIRILDSLVNVLESFPAARIEIGGHTDSVGSDVYNQDLSQRRSESVRRYLTSQGIAESRLSAIGYGEVAPIASNSTSEGRAQNRRIEFVLQP